MTERALDGHLRVLVVDDSALVRQCLCQLLEEGGRFAVVGCANDGQAAVELSAKLRPDLVLMDLHMPGMNGLEATQRIKRHPKAPMVIMVTLHDTPASQAAAKAAGVDAFVNKAAMAKKLPPLLSALRRTRKDPTRMPAGTGPATEGFDGALTPRERQVLQLIADGRSSKEVAHRLQISVATVDTHRSNLKRKLNLHSVSQLVRYAIRHRLIEP